MRGIFVPGWGARAVLYQPAMPDGWKAVDPPSFGATRGSVDAYMAWLRAECVACRQPLLLGGHSFGAALALLVAAEGEIPVEGLVLVGPSVLPLSKPMVLMLRDFLQRALGGWFPPGEARRSVIEALRWPLSALRLGREIRAFDLSDQLGRVRARGLRCTVVAASTDTLTPPELCRRVAELSGAAYRELDVDGGHLWFLGAPALLRDQLAR